MPREIELKLFDEFVLPQITPDVRRRQVDIRQLRPNWELNKEVLDHALGLLGGLAPHTTAYLVVADGFRDKAEKLAVEFRLAAIILPPEIMKTVFCWAIVSTKGTVFSIPPPY